MSKIVTLTLNPSIDKSSAFDELVPEQKIRCETPKFEPGGGGINVSRVIKKLGGESTAFFLEGGHTGQFLIELITKEGLDFKAFEIENQTRENLILVEKSKNNQFRFGMEGPFVAQQEWEGILEVIEKLEGVEYLVASGSLSPGIPDDFYARIAKIAKKKEIKLVVDTSGPALKLALEEGVFLCKPNLGELSSLAGAKDLGISEIEEYARPMIDSGKCEQMVVSLGPDGAFLINKTTALHVPSPKVEKLSTVGAGDSMVAGMVFKFFGGHSAEEAVKFGVACGSAATMNSGTELCKPEDVERLFKEINAR